MFNVTFGFLDPINDTENENVTPDAPVKKKRKPLRIRNTEDPNINPNCAFGNFVLGVFNIDSEKYDELEICLKELVIELSELKEIKNNDTDTETSDQIDYYLGGDLKFISLVMGINDANSAHPCPFCYAKNENFHIFDDCYNKMRTYGDKEQKGQKRVPIINFIPVNRVIVDVLHMFLRITDCLERCLVRELYTFDAAYKIKDAHSQRRYKEFLESIGIKEAAREEKDKYEFRDLNGTEKIKLMEHINLEELFPNLPYVKEKNKLWKSFRELMGLFKSVDSCPLLIETNSREFNKSFQDIYTKQHITPYIHILSHAHEMYAELKKKGLNLNMFSMEGVEYMNNQYTTYFQASNNKKAEGEKKLDMLQILNKRNRVELASHQDFVIKEKKLSFN